MACVRCRKRKIKCGGIPGLPCEQCSQAKEECVYRRVGQIDESKIQAFLLSRNKEQYRASSISSRRDQQTLPDYGTSIVAAIEPVDTQAFDYSRSLCQNHLSTATTHFGHYGTADAYQSNRYLRSGQPYNTNDLLHPFSFRLSPTNHSRVLGRTKFLERLYFSDATNSLQVRCACKFDSIGLATLLTVALFKAQIAQSIPQTGRPDLIHRMPLEMQILQGYVTGQESPGGLGTYNAPEVGDRNFLESNYSLLDSNSQFKDECEKWRAAVNLAAGAQYMKTPMNDQQYRE